MTASRRNRFTTENTEIVGSPRVEERQGGACLVIIHGDQLGRRVDLGDQPLTIGRSSQSGFQIPQPSVSRQHSCIWREGKTYRLRDLCSTNKTHINGNPTDDAILKDGDHITVGNTIFKFVGHNNVEAKYHEELYQLATQDVLTGLNNRRYFLEQLDHEIARYRRHQRPFSLILIDADHFKQVNDVHGHLVGDKVLRRLAQTIQGCVRADDLVARFGGEEFSILLPETRRDQACDIAETVRRQAEQTDYAIADLNVTISAGIAEWDAQMESEADLINAADDRLYQAKSEGRNRCCAG